MHRYCGNTEEEQKEMLRIMGLSSPEDLFTDIPPTIRMIRELELPQALWERDLVTRVSSLAKKNSNLNDLACFLGAGAYDRYIPALLHHLTGRQEFLTAYTPYQAEISQGTLQSIFEYQTMICELTGMDVANASMYDGASALAEAAISACNITRREKILVSEAVHPEYRSTIRTYCRFNGIKVEEMPLTNGAIDYGLLENIMDSSFAALIVSQPNFFGIVEDIERAAEIVHKVKALLVVSADPIALALLEAQGKSGADLVVGEGQQLGNPLGFGGPYLGFYASSEEFLRRMPGRIVGMTADNNGKRGFVLTIQTREQHIRREKATSNICSNEALCALAAAIYLATLGREGLRQVARLSLAKAHYAYEELIKTGLFKPLFPEAPFFYEFALNSREDIGSLNKRLLLNDMIGGYDLGQAYPQYRNGWLIAVTEKRTKAEIDKLVETAGDIHA